MGLFDKLSIGGLKGTQAALALGGIAVGGVLIASKLGSPSSGGGSSAGPTSGDVVTALRTGAQLGADVAAATLGPAASIAVAGLQVGERLGEIAASSLAAVAQTQANALADVSRTAVSANAAATIAMVDRLAAPAPQTTIHYDITAPYVQPAAPPPQLLSPAPSPAPAPVAVTAPPPPVQMGSVASRVAGGEAIAAAIAAPQGIPASAVIHEPEPEAAARGETQRQDPATGIFYDPAFGFFDTVKLGAGAV